MIWHEVLLFKLQSPHVVSQILGNRESSVLVNSQKQKNIISILFGTLLTFESWLNQFKLRKGST